jgi:putative methyltransferase (TIGR04325 family)
MTDQIYFSGDYKDFAEASGACIYGTGNMPERVLSGALKVLRGEAVAHKNGVLFDKIPYNFQLISTLLSAAICSDNRLYVLDFGGSLGTSYFHSRDFLQDVSEVEWSIVELPHFVASGIKYLQSKQLFFHESIEDCLRHHQRPNVVIISGVLSYLPEPWTILRHLLQIGPEYVFIDRTGLIDTPHDRLTLQHIPERIYLADHPAWFLSERRLLSYLSDAGYVSLCDFSTIDKYTLEGSNIFFKGFIFRKKRANSDRYA